MRPHRRRLALLAAVALVLAVALGGGALAAGTTVTLKLKLQYAKRHRTACHQSHNYRFYHRRSTVEYMGSVIPPPAGHFSVRLEVKRCVSGKWRDVRSHFTLGKKLTGEYKGFFSARALAPRSHKARAINYYYARAVVNGTRSRKVHFAITN